MESTPRLLEAVALTVDLPEVNLRRGQVGTIVDVLGSGKAFEVEFCDRKGRAYASLGLRTDQFMVLRYAPEAQHDRLAGLFAELEQEHGPIEPNVLEEVRREWPAPGEQARGRRSA